MVPVFFWWFHGLGDQIWTGVYPLGRSASLVGIILWSGWPDLNWRPRSPEPRALPTAPHPDIFILPRKHKIIAIML